MITVSEDPKKRVSVKISPKFSSNGFVQEIGSVTIELNYFDDNGDPVSDMKSVSDEIKAVIKDIYDDITEYWKKE